MSTIVRHGLSAALLLLCAAVQLDSTFAQEPSADISGASLEDLTQMQISVSSFARKDQDLWKTPAAVFIISKADIARSSVSSIPELLRMVPGLQVAQIDASSWAVSARGFNSVYAEKLLVLVDGRTVYSEIYSGEHWDQLDIPLQDIERIEVIRGPGAAVWGTNAVNGVINIITRRTRGTLGLQVTTNVSRIGEVASVQYGGTLGEQAQYRAFLSYLARNPLQTPTGARAFDGASTVRAGGRLDWQRSQADWITTSGDTYNGKIREDIISEASPLIGPNGDQHDSMSGGYLLSRWEHKSNQADTALQVYFDEQDRHELGGEARTRTLDVDYQDHVPGGLRNDLVWGTEFRFTADHLAGTVLPTRLSHYNNSLMDGFIQDEIAIIPKRLIATLGSKIQDGTLAGFEIQPSARLLWTPSGAQTFWAAVSRAATAPSIQDKDISLNLSFGSEGGLPIVGILEGNPNFKPETVVAYELGYRQRIRSTWTLDLAAFLNDNQRIQSLDISGFGFQPAPSPHIQVDLMYTNGFAARTKGIEGTLGWKPNASSSIQSSYTWMEAHLSQKETGPVSIVDAWNSPRSNAAIVASWSFAPNWSVSSFVSYVGSLATSDALSVGSSSLSSSSPVSAYTRADFHLVRQLGRSLQFGAGGTNLLTPRHLEFGSGTGFITPAYVPRSLSLNGTWTF